MSRTNLLLASLDDPIALALSILGMAILAGIVAGTASFAYRWYVRERMPDYLAVLLGLGAISIWLNTRATLSQFIGGGVPGLDTESAIVTVATFAVAASASTAAARTGDRLASQTFAFSGVRRMDGDVGQLVKAVGRFVAVELPETIDDIEGYDPVPPATKESLVGTTLLFPRRLTVQELRTRLVDRLKTDYGVGHVDLDLQEDATVEYLALGGRAAGLGPTLAPGTAALAIRADPAFSASPGDTVQVWRTGENGPERVITGELRAVVDDVATLAIDAAEADRFSPAESYRLVTMPTTDRPDREFASLLRAADETVGTLDVTAGGDLDGVTVGSLATTVVAVRPVSGNVDALPDHGRILEAGETVYVVARPDELRRIETAAMTQ